MNEFALEIVGGKHAMPNKEDVAKIRDELWRICAKAAKSWNLYIPFSEFKARQRDSSDLMFRPEDFERWDHRDRQGPGEGGLDLLGRYRFKDSLVTIYIDSCRKVEQWYNVPLDRLLDVVLVHELAHLMTHRGFGAKESLPTHFWEYTAQCVTYAYLLDRNHESLDVFKRLSAHQPFVYQTWESLEALHAASSCKDKFDAMIKNIFGAVTAKPLDTPVTERDDYIDETTYDE